MGAIRNLGKGGAGSLLGAAAGLALAPATGGASLAYALGGAAVGGSIGGSMDQKDAAKKGAKAQQAAANAAVAEQRLAREQMAQNLSPYRREGVQALNLLGGAGGARGLAGQPIDMSGLPSILPSDIGSDSLFQSLKRQAISGIESSAAARGKLFSGSTPQAIAERVNDLAMARAGQIQNMNIAARQGLLGERVAENERQYQQLYNIANLGQASAVQQASGSQQAASNIGSALMGGANAAAAGRIGAANAQSDMFSNLLTAGATMYGYNRMYPTPAAPPPTTPAPQLPMLNNPSRFSIFN